MTTLLGISTSMKPTKSASRGYLDVTMQLVSRIYPDVQILDLASTPVGFFQGQMPDDNSHPGNGEALRLVRETAALLFSVPAYWSGVSGVFKNFIDVLAGPLYDLSEPVTVFHRKPTGLIIVGADPVSARAGVRQAREIFQALGADLLEPIVCVDNPRASEQPYDEIQQALTILVGTLALRAAGRHTCQAPG